MISPTKATNILKRAFSANIGQSDQIKSIMNRHEKDEVEMLRLKFGFSGTWETVHYIASGQCI